MKHLYCAGSGCVTLIVNNPVLNSFLNSLVKLKTRVLDNSNPHESWMCLLNLAQDSNIQPSALHVYTNRQSWSLLWDESYTVYGVGHRDPTSYSRYCHSLSSRCFSILSCLVRLEIQDNLIRQMLLTTRWWNNIVIDCICVLMQTRNCDNVLIQVYTVQVIWGDF